MSEPGLSVRARVTITVEVVPDDTWGGDCRLDQVFREGAQSALAKVTRVLEEARGVRVVRTQAIDCVIATKEVPR